MCCHFNLKAFISLHYTPLVGPKAKGIFICESFVGCYILMLHFEGAVEISRFQKNMYYYYYYLFIKTPTSEENILYCILHSYTRITDKKYHRICIKSGSII